jgi:hypothetical protein
MEKQDIETLAGDGLGARATPELLAELVDELTSTKQTFLGRDGLGQARADHEATRYCWWTGQSEDGRKWRDNQPNKAEPDPFDGCSDARVRLADEIINEKAMLMVLAATRGIVRARPMEGTDEAKAAKVTVLLKWVVRNLWGSSYVREMMRAAQYVLGDTPAGAVLGIYWRREPGLELREVTLDGLLEVYRQALGLGLAEAPDPAAAVAAAGEQLEVLRGALTDPGREDEALAVVGSLFPYLRPARALKVVRGLRTAGRAEFPAPVLKVDQPALCAHRLCSEAWVPADTRDFQRARVYYLMEWLTKAEMLERQVSMGWDEGWVAEVVGDGEQKAGHAGEAVLCEVSLGPDGGVTEIRHEKKYQVWTAYFRAVNDDQVPGVYRVTFHHAVPDRAARAVELIPYSHGEYPAVFLSREVLTAGLLDSRGVPEIAAADQAALKLLVDTNANVTQFALPPVVSIGRKTAGRLRLRPLEEQRLKREGELKFMQPPSTSGTAQVGEMLDRVQARVDSYWGRSNPAVPGDRVAVRQEYEVGWWLAQLRDVFRQVLALCQQYMTPELLARVTGPDGRRLFADGEDIRGSFDVDLTFEPRDFDLEYVQAKVDLYGKILATIDRRNTVLTEVLVSNVLHAVDGSIADLAVLDVDRADGREADDEEMAFLKIAAGLNVPMVEEGQNHALRLQVLTGIGDRYPEAVRGLPPDRQERFLERVQHHEFMVQQKGANAQAGRVGVLQAEEAPAP